jgi:hypothetical protein
MTTVPPDIAGSGVSVAAVVAVAEVVPGADVSAVAEVVPGADVSAVAEVVPGADVSLGAAAVVTAAVAAGVVACGVSSSPPQAATTKANRSTKKTVPDAYIYPA